jgi:hypothetical protein
VGKLLKIGNQAINVRTEAYYNVEKPDSAPDWQWGFTVQFLFPKSIKAITCIVAMLLGLCAIAPAVQAADKPNIIVIWGDDIGGPTSAPTTTA